MPTHALAEVLVGGDDQHLFDPFVGVGDHGGRAERVVGLVLDHRPHDEPGCLERPLHHRDLGEDLRVHPLAGLVPGPHVVAEALDDVVGGDSDMGGAVLDERQRRADHAGRGGVRMAVAVP